jgi:hypothetical protein
MCDPGTKLKTRKPIVSREGKSGTEYSLYQSFDLENQQEADWVKLNRDISGKVAEILGKKDVKDFLKHDKVKSILPAVTPCFIYQKKSENEEGEEVFEEGSRPSCYFNFFEVNTDKWNFGTKVRIHGSTKDLPKEKWLRLLQNNTVEYTPFLSYLRISYVGGVFRLKVQLDSIIIHNFEKFERTSQMDNVQKQLGVSDEDRRRAAELEALLEMSAGEQRPATAKTNPVEDEGEQNHMNSTIEDFGNLKVYFERFIIPRLIKNTQNISFEKYIFFSLRWRFIIPILINQPPIITTMFADKVKKAREENELFLNEFINKPIRGVIDKFLHSNEKNYIRSLALYNRSYN